MNNVVVSYIPDVHNLLDLEPVSCCAYIVDYFA